VNFFFDVEIPCCEAQFFDDFPVAYLIVAVCDALEWYDLSNVIVTD
jgi:hypothetical protein